MAEKEPESSVVTFTDGDGCVRYADRHSKAYLKHLAREKAKADGATAPTGYTQPPAGLDPAAGPVLAYRDSDEAALADDTAGKTSRTSRRTEPKS
ncbi:hypothetical protein M1M07_07710 [Rhodococcus sp. HM1]|uniref:hypothetical protein n=1 Tax=Rhodococcus sp. HM1 TaxID=2937759 RepID=UPI00200A5744|nr:hypothetical protein [Rhodococcus sp. HM1]MCK8671003.1 hypothetical protein [Rhodococcus sp. HM1]